MTPVRGIAVVLLFFAWAMAPGPVRALNAEIKVSTEARSAIEAGLDRGEAQDVLVTYDAAAVRALAKQMRLDRRMPRHDDEILREKARGYAETKAAVAGNLGTGRPLVLKSYDQLPLEFVRVANKEAFLALLADARVTGIALPEVHTRTLLQSLPLINQPVAAQQGDLGAGTAVAVLDTGVDYTRAAFGSCSAPGSGCKVIYAQDFAPDDGVKDDDGHGTNVAAIVLGVAPETRIIALDVFRADGFAYSQDIIAAINWSIQQKSQYNIVAINLSLGGGKFTSPISSRSNPSKRAIDDARDAGIVVVVASGNDAYTNALASPAAVDTAVSVGAVYDSNMGYIGWSKCSDSTTAADKVTCFSNSAYFLTGLGPGALINAAGAQMGGTSQAAPHLAGAVAVLHAAYPADSVNQIVTRLATGVPVTDPRNLLVKPRVNLVQALGLDLVPDAFLFQDQTNAAPGVQVISNPVTITGLVGSVPISISSPGEYSVNGGAFATEAKTVASGDVVRVRVTSSATPGAVVSATLTAGGVSDTFSVTTAASANAPSVQLAPGMLAFGSISVGASSMQTLTLSNAGNATLSGISFGLTPGQDFSIGSNGCGTSLAPGQSCNLDVVFSPTAPAPRSGTLGVSSNASGSPHEVPLSGTGITVVALAEAVDNPALSFFSGGNSAWFGQTGVAFSGGDAARSGTVDHLQSTYIETTVAGPGTLSFYWKVSSEPNFDNLRFYLDGAELASISGEVDWTARTYSLGAGSHALRWTYSKDSSISSGMDAGFLDAVAFAPGEASVSLSPPSLDFGSIIVGATGSQFVVATNTGSASLTIGSVTIAGAGYSKTADSCSGASIPPSGSCSVSVQFGPTGLGASTGALTITGNASGSPYIATLTGSGIAATTLGAALDNASLSFTSGGSAPWFAQTATTRIAGNSTAQSGPAGDFQMSYLETTITGPGRLTYFWKVSSEPAYDRLALLLDGITQGWISGEIDWEQRFYDIGSGTHVVRWAYVRTAEEPGGADTGWVDQVSFQPLAAPANLAEALDAPSFAWRTIGIEGSAAPWTGQGAIAISGGDAAESPLIADVQSSEFRTTVRGPGTLTFKWKVSSENGFDFLCLYQDYTDSPQDCISGEVDWSPRTFSIPPGIWPIKWIYSKDELSSAGSDRGWVDQVSFTPTDVPLGEAVDNTLLSFETNPSAPWYGQAITALIGGDAAQSPPIADGQRTWLQTTVTGPGTLGFYWKVSSEPGYDYLRFYVDGVEVPAIPAISGEIDWMQRSVFVGSGGHVVTWAYWKDFYCCAGGLDSAWVDGVSFTPSSADTQAPGVPAALSALAVGPSQIDLSWTPPTDNVGVTEHRIYRDGTQIATVPGATYGYSDAGLAAATTYSYAVAACDAAGNCSAQSASVAASTLAPPDTQPPTVPTGLSATPVSSSQINVAWSASADNTAVVGYRIYRGGALLTTVSGSTLWYSDTGLSGSTSYSFTVSACDAAGNCSAPSAAASATTPAPPDVQAPSVPGGLTAIAASASQINLSWSASIDDVGVTQYRIYRGGAHIATLGASTTAYADTGLAALTAYSYTVAACDTANNCSAQSAPANAATMAGFTPTLASSWNLIGNSLAITLNMAAIFGGNANIASVWKWDAGAQNWAYYSPNLTSAQLTAFTDSRGYQVLSTIGPGEGYWVNTLNPVTLAVQSGAPYSINEVNFAAMPSSWNLVATAANTSPHVFANTVSGSPPPTGGVNDSFVSLWAWDAAQQNWYYYSPALENAPCGAIPKCGLPGVKSYADTRALLHFEDTGKKLGIGVGFWVNRP